MVDAGYPSSRRSDCLTQVGRLPNDYLVKVDVASMKVALELRSPFLDTELNQLAAAIDSNLKVYKGKQKYLLKRLAFDGRGELDRHEFRFVGTAENLSGQPQASRQPTVVRVSTAGPSALELEAGLEIGRAHV